MAMAAESGKSQLAGEFVAEKCGIPWGKGAGNVAVGADQQDLVSVGANGRRDGWLEDRYSGYIGAGLIRRRECDPRSAGGKRL